MRLKRGLALVMSVLLAVPGIVMPIGSVSAKAQTKIAVNKAEEILPYQDTSLSFEERAADLVSRMTLEEKMAQLGYKARESRDSACTVRLLERGFARSCKTGHSYKFSDSSFNVEYMEHGAYI